MNGAIKYPVSEGVNLYYIPAKRFKTVDIDVMFFSPLSEKNASMNALITPVLKSGCENYEDAAKLNTRLEELYGASLSACAAKMCEASVARFSMQYVNEKYLEEKGVDEAALSLLCDVIFKPVTENGAFKKEYFELERKNLIESIESVINDKRTYAAWRCKEEMCKNEPYGVFSQGKISVIKEITPEAAFDYYKNEMLCGKCDIYVCGDVDIDKTFGIIKSRFVGNHCADYPKTTVITDCKEPKRITEKMDVEQGKLSLGFRCGEISCQKDYFALYMFDKIFGGTPVSKLFNNVREKLSLAYYVSSQTDKLKGIMTINSGIEIPTFQAAYDEIFVQLEAMKKGDFTEEEQAAAQAASVNEIENIKDSPSAIIRYYASQIFSGMNLDPEEYLEGIKAAGREQIIDAANKIKLDTVYFLRNEEAE